MKKFLSLTVALAMTVAMVPATAFAKSDMKVSRIITAESDDILYDGSSITSGSITTQTRVAPVLTLTVDGALKERTQTFRLKLTNAEWLDEGDIQFEDEGAKQITVTNGTVDFIGGDETPKPDTSLKALQKKLDDLAAAKPATGKTFAEADFLAALEAELKDGGALNSGATINTAAVNKLLQWADKDIETQATTTPAPDSGLKDAQTEWNAVDSAVQAYVPLFHAIAAAETTAKNAEGDLSSALTTLETAIAAGGFTIVADDVASAVKSYLASGKASDLVAIGARGDTDAEAEFDKIFSTVDGKDSNDADVSAAIKKYIDDVAGSGKYYAAVEAIDTAQKAANVQLNKVKNALAKFNDKIGGGSSSAVDKLDAKTVVDKYNELKGNVREFKVYLTSHHVPATEQDAVIDLVKAVIDSGVTPTDVITGKTGSVTVERVTDTLALITIKTDNLLTDDTEVSIPLYTKLTGGETATVEVDPRDSEFSSDSKTFAKISEGSTESFIDGTKNFYDGDTMKTLYVDEVSAKTFEAGKEVKIKLSSGFKWGVSQDTLRSADGRNYISVYNNGTLEIDYSTMTVDGDEITFKFKDNKGASVNPATLKFANLTVKEDGADFGTTARVTVSGAGITKKTIEIGTYADFGLTLTAESKALPVIYSGSFDDDNETLKVTFEETVQNSWIPTRKTVFALPEGVKFVEVDVKKTENFSTINDFASDDLEKIMKDNIDGNEITIPANAIEVTKGKKAKFEVVFTITADPEFTGDVELKVNGPGVGNEELSKVVATVNSPLTVTSSVNEVKIDYRNVAVNSITITEAEAGLWEKGDIIALEVEEMQFESGIKAEVVSGDMKLEKLDGDNVEVDKKEGILKIKVKSTSSSTPAEIKIDGIQLYLNRSLPAGDYKLSVVATKEAQPADGRKDKDLLFANFYKERSKSATGGEWDTDSYGTTSFETDSVTVLEDFVKVVTAGRDQDDSTFTTKIVVPVGSDKIMAGQTEITIDSPAYINADGYTMLPVRAVIDALNGVAVVRWDDATKTCTISFGSRIFAMTVGSKTMNMNGVATALLAAPEIRNERIFLPLRDLGYALGLTDSKINWDSATNTATLN